MSERPAFYQVPLIESNFGSFRATSIPTASIDNHPRVAIAGFDDLVEYGIGLLDRLQRAGADAEHFFSVDPGRCDGDVKEVFRVRTSFPLIRADVMAMLGTFASRA